MRRNGPVQLIFLSIAYSAIADFLGVLLGLILRWRANFLLHFTAVVAINCYVELALYASNYQLLALPAAHSYDGRHFATFRARQRMWYIGDGHCRSIVAANRYESHPDQIKPPWKLTHRHCWAGGLLGFIFLSALNAASATSILICMSISSAKMRAAILPRMKKPATRAGGFVSDVKNAF